MSSTINTQNGTVVARRSTALLYPTLLIAGIAVIIVSMLGIAAMTGLLPQSQAVDARAAGGNDGNDGKDAARAKSAGSKTAPAAGGKTAAAAGARQ